MMPTSCRMMLASHPLMWPIDPLMLSGIDPDSKIMGAIPRASTGMMQNRGVKQKSPHDL
jgi:hypothetical protein